MRGSLFESLERRQLLSASLSGALDTAFGSSGIASVSVSGADYTNVLDMAIQPDGKILVAGSVEFSSGTQDIALVRFNANGTPDNSFGTDGVVLTDLSAPDAEGNRIILDGEKILVVGDANGDFAIARYNSDGSADKTFNGTGSETIDMGSDDDKAFGAVVEPNGRIVVEGQSGGQLALVGLKDDGSIDTAFGSSGKIYQDAPGFTASTDPTTDGTGNTLDGSGGIRTLSNGNLLVVSNEWDSDGSGRVDFAYYTASGSLVAFDRGADQSNGPDVVGFAFPGGGKVLTFSSDGTDTLQRYNADASLDTTFGDSGTVSSDLDWGADGTIEPNGQIVLAGTATIPGDTFTEGVAVEKFNANGSVDNSFGVNGVVITPSAGDTAATAVVDPSGNIVVASTNFGSVDPTFTAVRYLASQGVSAPTATLASAPALVHSGENQELLSITYSDADNLDPNSLQDGNITVTRNDGSGETLPTYFLSSTQNSDGSYTVTYQVQKDYSGHYFDALDNGSYTVSIGGGDVYSLDGAAVAGGHLGTFNINIAAPAGGIAAPTGTLDATSINTVDVTDQTLSVTFNSSIGIDANSFGDGLEVTGPNGFDQYASYDSEQSNANGTVTATFDLTHDDQGGVFSSADNGKYTVSMDADTVEDMDGNQNAAATLGTFTVDVPNAPAGDTGPAATLTSAPPLTSTGTDGETLTVTYNGSYGVAANTLGDNNLLVTGPDSFSENANFISSTTNSDGSVTATYSVSGGYYFGGGVTPVVTSGGTGISNAGVVSAAAETKAVNLTTAVKGIASSTTNDLIPIDFGNSLANGTYTVSLVAGQVYDSKGASAAAATLGTFDVNLPPNSNPTPIHPIFFDSSAISNLAGGKSTNVDPHHVALASLASSKVTAKTTPTRAHANVVTGKHHHHHKKKIAPAAVTQGVPQWRPPSGYVR